ncbi:MAG: hypothetical protein GY829_10780 [Gammaproteobacteria bacterium]|nr:hypothetical protein [Gammaproteobacteria bacterium]
MHNSAGTSETDKRVLLNQLIECSSSTLYRAYEDALWKQDKKASDFTAKDSSIEKRAIYARSLMSRAELLLKQINGESGQLLPLSAYLAEASPSLFTEYCYNSDPDEKPCRYERGGWYDTFDEPNIADALLNENYWKRINHVHSSGMGDVATAFIKDDIGNWSLKSFDSNPEELLKAYQDLGINTIATAAKIATGDLTGVSFDSIEKSKRMLAFSESIAFGKSTTTSTSIAEQQVAALREELISSLEGIKATHATSKEKIEETQPDERAEEQTSATIDNGLGEVTTTRDALCQALKDESNPAPEQSGIKDGSHLCNVTAGSQLSNLVELEQFWNEQLLADPGLFSVNDRNTRLKSLLNTVESTIALQSELAVLKQQKLQYQLKIAQLDAEHNKEVLVELSRYQMRLSKLQNVNYVVNVRATPPAKGTDKLRTNRSD